jgi:hypothetical protein
MSTTDWNPPPDMPGLDEGLFSPDSEELAFFLTETRITSESALKSHLIDVQARAYKVSLIVICPSLIISDRLYYL